MNSNFVVIGKTTNENDKEDIENDVDDDYGVDNAGEPEGEEFEQETGWRSCASMPTLLFVCKNLTMSADAWTKPLS